MGGEERFFRQIEAALAAAVRRILDPWLPKELIKFDSLKQAQDHFVLTKARGEGTPMELMGDGWERFRSVNVEFQVE